MSAAEEEADKARWAACEEGIELLHEGNFEAAVLELSDVVAEDEQNEYAAQFLGTAYYEQQKFEQALACFVRAMELKPRYLGALIGAGQTLRLMGQTERAIRMGKEVLRLHPDDPDALYLLGACHFQRGENRLAHGFLQRFLETGPEVEVMLEVQGMMQIIRGEVFPHPSADKDEAPN